MDIIKLKTPVLDRLTDAEFYEFCQDHHNLRIERCADHEITTIPPASSETDATRTNFRLVYKPFQRFASRDPCEAGSLSEKGEGGAERNWVYTNLKFAVVTNLPINWPTENSSTS